MAETADKEPDEFEKLRAARGEGWQWSRIQEESCPQCGLNPAAMEPQALGPRVVELAGKWRTFLVGADDRFLRHSPGPGVFSPLQYGAHVSGMLRVATERLELGLEQDAPTVPMFNPGQDEWAHYNDLEAQQLADELEGNASHVADILRGLDGSQWSRTVVNDRGQYGVHTFTLVGIGRNVVHESHHHLLDAKGTLALGAVP
ncbi:MAG TPA: DinB family protein [Acidimicrobiales bacterium]|nr:DinB family protein [Acidimicrobiales bacterium]